MIILDTHIWVNWIVRGEAALPPAMTEAMQKEDVSYPPGKNAKLTNHAKEEMVRRSISWPLLEQVLNNPQQNSVLSPQHLLLCDPQKVPKLCKIILDFRGQLN